MIIFRQIRCGTTLSEKRPRNPANCPDNVGEHAAKEESRLRENQDALSLTRNGLASNNFSFVWSYDLPAFPVTSERRGTQILANFAQNVSTLANEDYALRNPFLLIKTRIKTEI